MAPQRSRTTNTGGPSVRQERRNATGVSMPVSGLLAMAAPAFRLGPVQLQDAAHTTGASERTGSAVKTVQRFPFKYENEDTDRKFVVTHDGAWIRVTQVEGNKQEKAHSGEAHYEIGQDESDKAPVLELHRIDSDPVEGSGIGGLLMYYLALVAQEHKVARINILLPAATAAGFYEHMGARPFNAEVSQKREKQLSEDLFEDVDAYIAHRTSVEYDSNPANRKPGAKNFGQLPNEERERLVKERRQRFDKEEEGSQIKQMQAWVHGKALVVIPRMVADPDEMANRAGKSISKRWHKLDAKFHDRGNGTHLEIGPAVGKQAKTLAAHVKAALDAYAENPSYIKSKQTTAARQVLAKLADHTELFLAVNWYLGLLPKAPALSEAVGEKLKTKSYFYGLLKAQWEAYSGQTI